MDFIHAVKKVEEGKKVCRGYGDIVQMTSFKGIILLKYAHGGTTLRLGILNILAKDWKVME